MIVAATQLRAGLGIVERDEKGRILKGYPVFVVSVSKDCDRHHVHVKLDDRRNWCYDRAAQVEVQL